jgi:hypothetical protein
MPTTLPERYSLWRRRHFHGQAIKIASGVFLPEHPIRGLLLRANDLALAPEARNRRGPPGCCAAALLCNDLISPFDEGRRLDRQI